jgi:nucleoside-diphosphate-sugar epimerase
MRDTDSLDASWYESYRWEIDDFVTAIVDGHEPRLSGPSVLPTVAAIDECYARRQPLALPWFDDMPGGVVPPRATERQRRVLLTGGGGFIGGRTADVLSRRDGWTVRALVHNPGSASRLARLPVELVQGDLKSDADVARAIDGCDAVVHCAIGTAYGEPREIHAVTVDGTRRLAAAARQAGVTRFVHISSIGVHDTAFAGTIDESTPVNPPKGDWYGHTKSLAERAVRSEEARGLSVAILRPGCVYGPYGFTFVMNPLRFLAADRLVLEDCADLPANTVFVDNLVDAMMCALSAAPEAVAGQAFPISDGDSCTWGQYFDFFADRMGRVARRTTAHETGPKGDVTSRGLVGNLADTLLSMEAKQFAKKVLQSDPLGTVPRNLLARYPVLEQHARRLAGMNAPVTYRRDPPAAPDLFRMTGRRSGLSIDNARRRLAFTPPVSRADALATTWEWVTYARLL